MIPRTKVNYDLIDLLRSVFVLESRNSWRTKLTKELASLFQTENIILTSSGRGALYTLLKQLPHSRVLVPAYTCQAVIEAARLAGKAVLYAKCRPDTFNMTTESVQTLADSDTIVIATHQFGIPCEIDAIVQAATRAGSFVLEDAAAALGTKYDSQLVGNFGHAAIFSFDSTKLVNAPLKGGFLLVREDKLYRRCVQSHGLERRLPLWLKLQYLLMASILVLIENHFLYRLFHTVNFRWRNRYTEDEPLSKCRYSPYYRYELQEWQAKVVAPQVRNLDSLVTKRQQLYSGYLLALKNLKHIRPPPEDTDSSWACIRFPILVLGVDKLDFYAAATDLGVDFAFSFSFICAPASFRIEHDIAARILDLPFYNKLSGKEFDRTVSALRKIDQDI